MGKYRRIILKLSGEALAGDRGFGIDPDILRNIAEEIKQVQEAGIEVAIVVGAAIFGAALQAALKG